jgi:hypothetical protein
MEEKYYRVDNGKRNCLRLMIHPEERIECDENWNTKDGFMLFRLSSGEDNELPGDSKGKSVDRMLRVDVEKGGPSKTIFKFVGHRLHWGFTYPEGKKTWAETRYLVTLKIYWQHETWQESEERKAGKKAEGEPKEAAKTNAAHTKAEQMKAQQKHPHPTQQPHPTEHPHPAPGTQSREGTDLEHK